MEYIIGIYLSNKLNLQLGFEPNTNLYDKPIGIRPPNIQLGLPSQFFIYCDIISPQIVGDVLAPLLRVIAMNTLKYTYGTNRMMTFSPPYYLPIMRREFDIIEIDIRSETGEPIPFEFGTSCIKLHFKRITL